MDSNLHRAVAWATLLATGLALGAGAVLGGIAWSADRTKRAIEGAACEQ